MEGQLLIAQLAVLLEHGAAQHRLGRQPLSPGRFDAVPAQVRCNQAGQLAMVVEPADIACSSRPISCPANRSNMLAWTVRSWRIVGSGGCGLCFGISGLMPKSTRSRRSLPTQNRDSSHYSNGLRLWMSTRLVAAWQLSGNQALDEAYVPFFGAFGTASGRRPERAREP